jgi:hypothetical protein
MASHRFALLTFPVAAALLALAACGGGDPDAATGGDRRSEMRDAALDFAECMREHGVDMEDPRPDGGILLKAGPESGNAPASVRNAEEACRKHLEQVEPPEISEEQQREFKERALKFARCMREHGIDMPDPTFGEGGRMTQRLEGGELDPEDPRFREASEACSRYQPRMSMGESSR